MRSSVAPSTDESAVRALLCALQINPARCVIHKGGERSTLTVDVTQKDAIILEGARLVMLWAQRQISFCFEAVKGTVSNQVAASKGSTLPRPPCVSDEFGVCPMPSAKRFDDMVDDEKRSVLEHALVERLPYSEYETIVGTAVTTVENYRGQEGQLYDMISELGAKAVCEAHNASSSEMQVDSPESSFEFDTNDLIEIGQSCGGGLKSVHDGSLIIRVKDVVRNACSVHVNGTLFSVTGKEKNCVKCS